MLAQKMKFADLDFLIWLLGWVNCYGTRFIGQWLGVNAQLNFHLEEGVLLVLFASKNRNPELCAH